MRRFDLLPSITRDGRRIVLRAVPVSRVERLRRLLDQLRLRTGA